MQPVAVDDAGKWSRRDLNRQLFRSARVAASQAQLGKQRLRVFPKSKAVRDCRSRSGRPDCADRNVASSLINVHPARAQAYAKVLFPANVSPHSSIPRPSRSTRAPCTGARYLVRAASGSRHRESSSRKKAASATVSCVTHPNAKPLAEIAHDEIGRVRNHRDQVLRASGTQAARQAPVPDARSHRARAEPDPLRISGVKFGPTRGCSLQDSAGIGLDFHRKSERIESRFSGQLEIAEHRVGELWIELQACAPCDQHVSLSD